MTQEDFILKGKLKYGNKYDYSYVNYVNNKTKVKVKCTRCGDVFSVRPNDFLNKSACKNCRKFFEKETYIEKFIKKHGNKYDYSLMLNNKIYTKDDLITIICPIHGKFEQKIKNHLHGNGCKLCGIEKSKTSRKISNNIIKERLEKICGNNVSFNINEYINTNTPLKLKCNNCNKFFLRDVNALLYNNSCPYCNSKQRNLTYDNNEFIEKAKVVHGDRYDYSKTVYEKTDKKICVICHEKDKFNNEHGIFWVTPHAHIGMMKSGCPKCSGKYKKTTEDFIKEAKLIHGDFYNYNNVFYENAKTKISIGCPIHGYFNQTPNMHLSGKGCPICKESSFERKIRLFFNEHNINFTSQYKPSWLKPLSIDFFIKEINLAIEVQGIQHFMPVKYWGDEKKLLKVIERDNIKKKKCEENGVNLIYYSELKIDFPYVVINNTIDLLNEIQKYYKKNLDK